MRHAKSTTMLDHYAQTDMDELIAAQEMMLDAIFGHKEGAVLVERTEERIKTGTGQMGQRLQTVEKKW